MARRLLFWLFQNLVFLGILRSESNNATFSFFLLPCFLHLDSCDIFYFFFLWTLIFLPFFLHVHFWYVLTATATATLFEYDWIFYH